MQLRASPVPAVEDEQRLVPMAEPGDHAVERFANRGLFATPAA
jgi:hypothetical protein